VRLLDDNGECNFLDNRSFDASTQARRRQKIAGKKSPDLGERWPTRLVAPAAANCLTKRSADSRLQPSPGASARFFLDNDLHFLENAPLVLVWFVLWDSVERLGERPS
jgi:hypothetical protein